ncbi:MAG TPA: hypothetical protein VM345_17980 [Acidimicrobiales bacterium]|jgi:hypothetical protein|nr:hypothetical protein [Acidimicrobiales bacterium]
MALANDAGIGKVSFTSVLAGMLCAFGAFAVLAAIAGAVLRALGIEDVNDISGDWRDVGIGGAAVLAVVMLLSYFFGGYVAGRMARRAGALNGVLVFVLGVLVVAAVAAAVGTQADAEMVRDNLSSIGLPTTADEWTAIGTGAGIAALAAMLIGSIFGGVTGERWHGKLLARALDPSVGPEIDLRDRDRDGRDGTDDRTRTLDEDRTEVRDRTMVASGNRPDGAHFMDRDGDGRTGTDEIGDGWDGSNDTRRVESTSTTLDEDLNRQAK